MKGSFKGSRLHTTVLNCLTSVMLVAAVACGSREPAAVPPLRDTQKSLIVSSEDYRILVRAIGTEDPYELPSVRNTANDILRETDLPRQVAELLRQAPLDEQQRVVSALGHGNDPRIVPVLIELLRNRPLSTWALSALTDIGEPAVPLLFAALDTPPNEPAWPFEPNRIRTPSDDARSAMSNMGPRAVPFLVRYVGNGDDGRRRKALSVLAEMHPWTFGQVDLSSYIADFRIALKAPDAQTRYSALRILTSLEPPDVLASYRQDLRQDPSQAVSSWAGYLEQVVVERRSCARAADSVQRLFESGQPRSAGVTLANLRSRLKDECDAELTDVLISRLNDPSPSVREVAINGLAGISNLRAKRALGTHFEIELVPALRGTIIEGVFLDPEILRALLRGESLTERRLAVGAIGASNNPAMAPDLVALLDDADLSEDARLALIVLEGPRAVPPLIDAFRKTPESALPRRGQYVSSIGNLGGLPGVTFAAETLVTDPQMNTRYSAAESLHNVASRLGRTATFKDILRPYLLKAVNDTASPVRVAVVPLLQFTRDVAGLVDLAERDADASVRITAFEALGEICTVDAARALFSQLTSSDYDRRLRATTLVGRLHYCMEAPVLAVLREQVGPVLIARVANEDPRLAAAAAASLANFRNEAGLDPIIRRFEERPEERLFLALALSMYGPAAKRAGPALQKARPDASPEVVQAIDQALRGIK